MVMRGSIHQWRHAMFRSLNTLKDIRSAHIVSAAADYDVDLHLCVVARHAAGKPLDFGPHFELEAALPKTSAQE